MNVHMKASLAPKDGMTAVFAAVAAMPRRTRLLGGAAAIALVAIAWFASIPHGILMGDDIALVDAVRHGQYASTIRRR